MPRSRRHKSQQSTFYHLYNRVAGDPHDYPFEDPAAAQKFLSLCETYLDLYFCCLAAFELLGNHYHLVVFVEQFRELSDLCGDGEPATGADPDGNSLTETCSMFPASCSISTASSPSGSTAATIVGAPSGRIASKTPNCSISKPFKRRSFMWSSMPFGPA